MHFIRKLTQVLIRLIALYFFLLGFNGFISYIAFSIPNMLQSPNTLQMAFTILAPLTNILTAVFLWILSERLARFIMGPDSVEEIKQPHHNAETADYILSMIISIAGLLIFAYSLTMLLQNMINIFYFEILGYYKLDVTEGQIFKNYILPMIRSTLLVLVGGLIAFKGKGILKLIKSVQSVGTIKKDHEQNWATRL